MSFLVTLALLAQKYGIWLFLVSLGCSFYGRSQANQGNISRAIKFVRVAAISATILCGSYAILGLVVQEGITLLMAAIWGFFAWRDWRDLKILKSR